MNHRRAFLLTAGLAALTSASTVHWSAATFAQSTPDAMAKAVNADDMKWEPLGHSGDEISILYINPTTQATYLVIRNPANQHVPRHWHSSNESITVIKGTFEVAHDGSNDKTVLTPGGFVYMPAKMIHEAWAGDQGATYFITVDGKWDVNLVK
jgi:quercetin dioxygenase-like cupin family protein